MLKTHNHMHSLRLYNVYILKLTWQKSTGTKKETSIETLKVGEGRERSRMNMTHNEQLLACF
jgi:hypothetical protein